MDKLKFSLFAVLISSCIASNFVLSLCHSLHATCLERGTDTFNRFPDTNDRAVQNTRHCEVLLTLLECVEDFICSCNVTLTSEIRVLFDQSYTEYHDYCRYVSTHKVRTDANIRCEPIRTNGTVQDDTQPTRGPTKPSPGEDPNTDLEVGEELELGKVQELDAKILAECREYEHCSDVYFDGLTKVHALPPHLQLADRCMVSRYNLVCMSDSFCTCGHADDILLRDTMSQIVKLHEQKCHEKLSEPILECSASGLKLHAWCLAVTFLITLCCLQR